MKIALVGMPGCGKSTLGLMLAQCLQLPFVDLDAVIEQRSGMAISQYFARHGQEKFRQLESALLVELAATPQILLATGGGAVLSGANRQVLKQQMFTLYLHCPPEKLSRRLQHDKKRPLLQGSTDKGAALAELYRQRHPLYNESAHLTVSSAELDFYPILDTLRRAVA